METLLSALRWSFLAKVFSVITINLVLSGDNGVVIALAVRMLPCQLRLRALAVGAAGVVVIQVAATLFAQQLLQVQFLRLGGGVVILWISLNLFRDAEQRQALEARLGSLWRAIWFIILADLSMSLDNVLAVAAAAEGQLSLLLFGLGLSVPFVLLGANLLAALMDRYPLLVYLGAGILGSLGAEMIMTDSFTVHALQPSGPWRHGAEVAGAMAVLAVGRIQTARRRPPSHNQHERVLRNEIVPGGGSHPGEIGADSEESAKPSTTENGLPCSRPPCLVSAQTASIGCPEGAVPLPEHMSAE